MEPALHSDQLPPSIPLLSSLSHETPGLCPIPECFDTDLAQLPKLLWNGCLGLGSCCCGDQKQIGKERLYLTCTSTLIDHH